MTSRLIKEFYDLRVDQLMDKRLWDIPVIEAHEGIEQVMKIFRRRHHVWVIKDKTRRLVGVITEHDVFSIMAPKKMSSYVIGMPDIRSLQYGTIKTAEDIMSSKMITCKPNDTIRTVLQKMARYRVRRIPVVEDKILVGELTLNQMIRKFYDASQYDSIV